MHRAALPALAIAALTFAAPITVPAKAVEKRQFTIGDPSTGGLVPNDELEKRQFLIGVPTTDGLVPNNDVEKRQSTFGDPGTGGLIPGDGDDPVDDGSDPTTISTPSTGGLDPSRKNRRQSLGGSGPDPTQAEIDEWEVEVEALLQAYPDTDTAPLPVKEEIAKLEAELLVYGIKVEKSPDGTVTIITPGKRAMPVPTVEPSGQTMKIAHD
ncbi:hypothetical protein F5Y16DRAFT_43792 [Xylariaceae sp. FL0255]|nr:hypothetical protein F5Y16DRAFT_43792 [Xylariaceae sp. FL0255]